MPFVIFFYFLLLLFYYFILHFLAKLSCLLLEYDDIRYYS